MVCVWSVVVHVGVCDAGEIPPADPAGQVLPFISICSAKCFMAERQWRIYLNVFKWEHNWSD